MADLNNQAKREINEIIPEDFGLVKVKPVRTPPPVRPCWQVLLIGVCLLVLVVGACWLLVLVARWFLWW